MVANSGRYQIPSMHACLLGIYVKKVGNDEMDNQTLVQKNVVAEPSYSRWLPTDKLWMAEGVEGPCLPVYYCCIFSSHTHK